ncbi:MAG: peptide chain release factor 2 [Clostridia bacterium]|nr:peptide chain release factor 2 [Clostridia bacterium]
MIEFYNEKLKLEELTQSIKTSADAINLPELQVELVELRKKQEEEGFWLDVERAKVVNVRISEIERKVDTVSRLKQEAEGCLELMEMAEEMQEEGAVEDVRAMLKSLEAETEKLFLESLMKGKYDSNNALLTLHAGAGGTEAQDWADMLYRMYTRYAERAGYNVSELDYQAGDEAGIKSVTFKLEGSNAYGFLKAEKGVHRLVRISPFDANKRRHTSFASLEVMPEIINDDEIKIKPEELKIDTCRSSGAGGQHVNKTESAVRITHLPTGIVTWCQSERSQVQNKETAMRMLYSKLAELKEREQMEEALSIKGEIKKIEWGSQIRSYVFCPYTLVKDHRTGYENTNVGAVMDGDIEGFIYDYLVKSNQ